MYLQSVGVKEAYVNDVNQAVNPDAQTVSPSVGRTMTAVVSGMKIARTIWMGLLNRRTAQRLASFHDLNHISNLQEENGCGSSGNAVSKNQLRHFPCPNEGYGKTGNGLPGEGCKISFYDYHWCDKGYAPQNQRLKAFYARQRLYLYAKLFGDRKREEFTNPPPDAGDAASSKAGGWWCGGGSFRKFKTCTSFFATTFPNQRTADRTFL
jgi:hypothetical protein